MREVGGYQSLMEMPVPAIQEVWDFLIWEAKEQERASKKGGRR